MAASGRPEGADSVGTRFAKNPQDQRAEERMGLLEADAVRELLRVADYNHRVIANNLANLNTPGYKTLRVAFKEALDEVLDERGRLRSGKHIRTELYSPLFAGASADGNDVSLEREMVELNKNALMMRVYLAVLGARIRAMRTAIEGR